MELENVIKLINAVSESSLTSFSMEDGDTKLSLGADRSDRAAVKETAGADDIVNSDNGNESGLNKSDIKTSDDNVLDMKAASCKTFPAHKNSYNSAPPHITSHNYQVNMSVLQLHPFFLLVQLFLPPVL